MTPTVPIPLERIRRYANWLRREARCRNVEELDAPREARNGYDEIADVLDAHADLLAAPAAAPSSIDRLPRFQHEIGGECVNLTAVKLLLGAAAPSSQWQPMSKIPPTCTWYLITDGKGEWHVAYWAMPSMGRMHWTGFVAHKQGFEVRWWMALDALPAPPEEPR